MKTSEAGLALIRRFEGFSAMPYVCPAGYVTVGFGHVVKKGEDFKGGITQETALELLRKDVRAAEASVARLIRVPLMQPHFDALVSFTYNLGGGALQRSTMRRKINRCDFIAALPEFAKWSYAGGRKLKGLVRRRLAEAELFSLGNEAMQKTMLFTITTKESLNAKRPR